MADQFKPEKAEPLGGLTRTTIGGWDQGELRRFIVNLLSSDPGIIHKSAAVAAVSTSPLTTKGDLDTFDTAETRLPVGADGQILQADSTQATGLKWAASGTFVPPTGTGFAHVTAGALDAASKLVDTADINNDQVTYAKIQNVAANNRVLGRVSGAGGDIEELTAAQVNTLTGNPGFTPTGTGFTHETSGVQDAAAKLVDTADINNSQVTYAKIQNIVNNNCLLGTIAGSNTPITELTGTDVTALLNLFTGSLKGLVPSGGTSGTWLRGDATWTVPPAAGAAGGDLAGSYPNPTVAHLSDTIWRLVKVVTITSGVSYTPTTGVDALYVECIGGGGGGGACATAVTNSAAAGGGASGGYSAAWVTTLVSGAHTIQVGGGGAGGVAGANNGTGGGDTIFKDNAGTNIVVAKGGGGGVADTVAAGPRVGGTGGLPVNLGAVGDLKASGSTGTNGLALAAAQAISGSGGGSFWQGNGQGRNTQGAGGNALAFGGGGGGACILSGGASVAGGNGSAGVIRVWEFQKAT